MNDEITREQDDTTLEQGGFDAISEKLHALYPGQEGRFYGTVIPYFLGGNDPLDGVEVWKSEEGIPHWHYVTYGFTELYQKECEDPEVSGFAGRGGGTAGLAHESAAESGPLCLFQRQSVRPRTSSGLQQPHCSGIGYPAHSSCVPD